ncbi:MAG: biotin--[acetyl-CoA-carboxylase] ligase [Ignavibacteria bacterium]|nr:biotin--[acetyl-CoA-carboxylase] ligase [Ignavibacteria bacterium]
MNTEYLNEQLKVNGKLAKIIYFEELESTNLFAKQHYHELDSNSLILTSYQTQGKGRFDRKWQSEKDKNLTFSLIYAADLNTDEFHLVNFYTSYIFYLTIKSLIREYQNSYIRLKWPNDILLNGKKVAGILTDVKDTEIAYKKFIIGAGLNVNMNDFSAEIERKATSLRKEFNTEFDIEKILTAFINNFYDNAGLVKEQQTLMKKWNEASDMKNNTITFRQSENEKEITAVAETVDTDGGLVIINESGIRSKYYSGEISLIY